MIPNNNLSVLPWYNSLDEQNARKWWVYGRVYPLFCEAGFMPAWQFIIPTADYVSFQTLTIKDANTNGTVMIISNINFPYYGINISTVGDYTILSYSGTFTLVNSQQNGRYYAILRHNNTDFYSEIFTVVNDISPYLKLEWWDEDNFLMDAGAIAYVGTNFRNILYLPSDIAKPEYQFEEEGSERDGYFYPVKQISYKQFRFNFLAPEYLLDVLRFVRMADYAQVTKGGKVYTLDTFLITPEWESEGDIAVVSAEFRTATVAKRIGVGYTRSGKGDFNDDFNNDYNNQNP